MPHNNWEEELKRQCEIRNLPFNNVLYLVKEVLSSEHTRLLDEIEGMKYLGFTPTLDDIITRLKKK